MMLCYISGKAIRTSTTHLLFHCENGTFSRRVGIHKEHSTRFRLTSDKSIMTAWKMCRPYINIIKCCGLGTILLSKQIAWIIFIENSTLQ